MSTGLQQGTPDRRFDVIVIGSGIGGLTAGALAARSGKKVLVLEKNPTWGGAAGVYNIGKLAVESSLHEMDGLDPADPKIPVVRRLDIQRGVRFVGCNDLWQVRSPVLGEPFVMPEGIDAGREACLARFPHQRAALEEYFMRIGELRTSLSQVIRRQGDKRWFYLMGGALKLRPALRLKGISLGAMLDKLFGEDEAVKLALGAHLIYYTDDPDQMAFSRWATAQASYHIGGGHYPYGGSKALADYLAGRIIESGGDVETGRRVTRILVTDGHVTGVEHESSTDPAGPRVDAAPLVFGNAAPHALAEMLEGDEERAAFMTPYTSRPVSLSLWTIAFGFNRKLSELGVSHYSNPVFPAPLRALRDVAKGTPLPGASFDGTVPHYIFVDYTAVDTGLAREPPYLGTAVGLDRVENWDGLSAAEYDLRRERWMDLVVESLEQEFPGLAAAIVQRSMTTAQGAASYLGTPGGAMYGFAPVSRNRVLSTETPIAGLWLSSAYGGLGGYSGAMIGAGSAVKSALGETWRDWGGV